MEHFVLLVYILFAATGFAGIAALIFFKVRTGSRIAGPLLGIQVCFLFGLSLVAAYFYLSNIAATLGGEPIALENAIATVSGVVNVGVYTLAIVVMRRLVPRSAPLRVVRTIALVPAALFALKAAITFALLLFAGTWADGLVRAAAWNLPGYLLSGLAITGFGVVLLGCEDPAGGPSVRPLLRGYGACALAFAPLGVLEFALNASGRQPFRPLSLDFLFYLAWNVVSMTAFFRSLHVVAAPLEAGVAEAPAALGLTGREREMALLIARGLANKQIAAELGIAPATVRTHIYNLYQKVGVRSRIELLNRLRGGI